MTVLKDTGERVIPEAMKPMNESLLEHIARYHFSAAYVTGRTLDIACGTGYGAKFIAKTRKKQISDMLGVDVCPETIDYAVKHYYHPLLKFQTGDALDPELKKQIGTFDTILSFETIEHVPDDRVFLSRLNELLNPGGTLVISTPFGEGRGVPCGQEFHYHQLTEAEFFSLFQEQQYDFAEISHFFQNGVAIESTKRKDVYYPIGIAVCKKQL
ncbi:class I SAM-dependent methyltransferase [Alteribacter natronophilus]|uniref:class I SAM-dependent methyltransferase n=1 Tax=Alteribacter natronophilus TaxID=2583810 RepID=UPI00110DA9A8|nr:class I SAM-dependent methyltransferase [Alteribacter natronophilus]TMW73909.1 class I SAM-dependent methyltransferase [Alteribacter natronophilus]